MTDVARELAIAAEMARIDLRRIQARTLRWAASQARGALHDDAGAILERFAARVESGELEVL